MVSKGETSYGIWSLPDALYMKTRDLKVADSIFNVAWTVRGCAPNCPCHIKNEMRPACVPGSPSPFLAYGIIHRVSSSPFLNFSISEKAI